MGALFHQFTGTPVNLRIAEDLERAIAEAISLQPAIRDVEVHIDRNASWRRQENLDTHHSQEMLDVTLTVEYGSAVIRVRLEVH